MSDSVWPHRRSPPGSAVPGILQARTLEWVAISFSNAWKWKVKVKSLSKCPTLRDSMDCSLPGSSVHGIFQARVLEWGAIVAQHSNDKTDLELLNISLEFIHTLSDMRLYYKQVVYMQCCVCMLSRVWFSVTPLTIACQASLSMEFSKQEYWSRLPFLSPQDLPDSGIELVFFVSPATGSSNQR